MKLLLQLLRCAVLVLVFSAPAFAQQSVARRWNEVLLQSIREDFARPPVHARNLFHTSLAMYDAWAAYDDEAQPYLLGKTVGNYTCAFDGVLPPADVQAARDMAMSYAVFRVLIQRFINSPNVGTTYSRFYNLMIQLGYDYNFTDTDYHSGNPAALGNYIGQCVIQMGLQDGSNEAANYASQYYTTVNPPLVMADPGNPNIVDPNHWQRLYLTTAIDQNGNPIPSTQVFQSPEWGNVVPFALKQSDKTVFQRNGHDYPVYHDPGPPATLDTANGGGSSAAFRWNHELVAIWASHLDPSDSVLWDISPRSIGNVQWLPQTIADLPNFYKLEEGGENAGIGRAINPRTGLPYEPQIVHRGDYTRVLAQFWADGPTSETPPGHWFSILNYVTDQPGFSWKFNGKGPVLDQTEWLVKAYLTLGGAVHDAAVTAWGMKGWYDSVRPVSAIRYMADRGQSSDSLLPHYDPAGITLHPGFIELVQPGDPLAGPNGENVNKIKLYTFRGPLTVTDPVNQTAGVGWILAENWWPYQRKTFVTPPFAGYISGHSTFSRAAAEVLTAVTGDEYFPGGMGQFHIGANSGFLGLEKGPSQDVTLQWATYRDASDQCSLSRIWGGIHPPMDDIPGRLAGTKIANDAFHRAESYFYADADQDGYYSFEDCDDNNAAISPNALELCDGIDNNCNGLTDDTQTFTYYVDVDQDGFGSDAISMDTCLLFAPAGFTDNNADCDDANASINPDALEACDGIDNNCNGLVDDTQFYTYYADADQDGFGSQIVSIDTCLLPVPAGYVTNNEDCDDTNAAINPFADEVCDGLDNDCNGLVDDAFIFTYYADADQDGYGTENTSIDTCLVFAPAGYVSNNLDCDDSDFFINPDAVEECDGFDNNCNGATDEGLALFTYFADLDADGFGSSISVFETCESTAPFGYVTNGDDCDDSNADVNPDAPEIIDGIDNNCNGLIDGTDATTDLTTLGYSIWPNPVYGALLIGCSAESGSLPVRVFAASGQLMIDLALPVSGHAASLDFSALAPGLYILKITDPQKGVEVATKVVKM